MSEVAAPCSGSRHEGHAGNLARCARRAALVGPDAGIQRAYRATRRTVIPGIAVRRAPRAPVQRPDFVAAAAARGAVGALVRRAPVPHRCPGRGCGRAGARCGGAVSAWRAELTIPVAARRQQRQDHGQGDDLQHPRAGRAVPVQAKCRRRPHNGDEGRFEATENGAASGRFERPRIVDVADEPVREHERQGVSGTGRRNAEGRRGATPRVLKDRAQSPVDDKEGASTGNGRRKRRRPRPRRLVLADRLGDVDELHPVPGLESGVGGHVRSEERLSRPADELPSTRGRERIDSCIPVGHGQRSTGNRRGRGRGRRGTCRRCSGRPVR